MEPNSTIRALSIIATLPKSMIFHSSCMAQAFLEFAGEDIIHKVICLQANPGTTEDTASISVIPVDMCREEECGRYLLVIYYMVSSTGIPDIHPNTLSMHHTWYLQHSTGCVLSRGSSSCSAIEMSISHDKSRRAIRLNCRQKKEDASEAILL